MPNLNSYVQALAQLAKEPDQATVLASEKVIADFISVIGQDREAIKQGLTDMDKAVRDEASRNPALAEFLTSTSFCDYIAQRRREI